MKQEQRIFERNVYRRVESVSICNSVKENRETGLSQDEALASRPTS